MIAYRLQAEVFGDLDAETLRLLKKIDVAPSKSEIASLTKILTQRQRELSPGTILVREWNGQAHRVMVIEQGFAWQGNTYDSLSKIAQAITGTKWNGPRFFGLRDKTLHRGRGHDCAGKAIRCAIYTRVSTEFRSRSRIQLTGRTVRSIFGLYPQPGTCALDACAN